MKHFSALFIFTAAVLICLVVPLLAGFLSFSNRIIDLAIEENVQTYQDELSYIENSFSQLTSSAKAEVVHISNAKDYVTAMSHAGSYEQLVADAEIYHGIEDISIRLAALQYSDSRLRNLYLYSMDSDFIITSDRGVLRLDQCNDIGWIDDYSFACKNDGFKRTSLWLSRIAPEYDLLYKGGNEDGISVISYISPFRLTTSNICLLVLNYYENDLALLCNNKETDNQEIFFVNCNGYVTLHSEMEYLYQDFSSNVLIANMLSGDEKNGYLLSGKPSSLKLLLNQEPISILTYRYIDSMKSYLVGLNSMEGYSTSTINYLRLYIIIISVLSLIGGVVCYWIFKKMLRPVKKLVTDVQENGDVRNELFLIEDKISQMQKREGLLIQRMSEVKDDVTGIYLMSLLRDIPYLRESPVNWNHDYFIVVMVEIDKLNTGSATSESQYAAASLINNISEEVYKQVAMSKTLIINNRTIVSVLNVDESVDVETEIKPAVELIQKAFYESNSVFTISIGFSLPHKGEQGIYHGYQQAQIACRQKMILGKGIVCCYKHSMAKGGIISYPEKLEQDLLRGIVSCDVDVAEQALHEIDVHMKTLNPELIRECFTRLNAALVTYMGNRYELTTVFEDGISEWNEEDNAAETLDELLSLLRLRALTALSYCETLKCETCYTQTIMDYLKQHYREDIDFEMMATEIEISYSYIRRIVKSQTGQNMLDIIHHLRIDEAKHIIATESEAAIKDIAARVGYHNIQSFNRYFRRFENVTPSEYRDGLN